MYAYLRGIVAEKNITANKLILELNGIGYSIETSLKTLNQVKTGEELVIYTNLISNESGMRLIGFVSKIEKEIFELLVSVSGVGPKVALSVLNCFSVDELLTAVIQEDTKFLASAPGLGPKGAGRIILELKNKLKKLNPSQTNTNKNQYSCADDIHSILSGLGFDQLEIQRVLIAAQTNNIKDDPELLIKFALSSTN